jgi:hypothetical protein
MIKVTGLYWLQTQDILVTVSTKSLTKRQFNSWGQIESRSYSNFIRDMLVLLYKKIKEENGENTAQQNLILVTHRRKCVRISITIFTFRSMNMSHSNHVRRRAAGKTKSNNSAESLTLDPESKQKIWKQKFTILKETNYSAQK